MAFRRWGCPLTRRRFLRMMGSTTAALALVACGQQTPAAQKSTSDESEETTGPTSASTVRKPQRGGTLRVAFPGTPTSLDPALFAVYEDWNIARAIYEPLVRLDENLELQPGLATSWEAAEDRLSWTFTLREGVTFHDGSPFGSEDVVYTFERGLDPDFGSEIGVVLGTITAVEAVDDLTMRFDLSKPSADFPVLMSYAYTGIVPRNRSSEDLAAEPVGTGPFRFAEYTPGERLRLVRNDTYWQPDLPYLDALEHFYISEPTTGIEALNSGVVDVIWNLTIENVALVEVNSDLELLETMDFIYQPIVMQVNQSPLNDERVREALKLCVDRAGMLQVVFQGRGVIGNDQPVPPWHRFFADIPPREQDIERARELLTEAGYADGLTLEMATSAARPGMVEIAVAFQEMAQHAGITINLERLPTDTYWGDYLSYPLAVSFWSYESPSIAALLRAVYHSDASYNETGYTNSKLDELIEQAEQEPDEETRAQMYAQVQQILSDDGGEITAFLRPLFAARKAAVQDVALIGGALVDMSAAWIEQEG